MAHDSDLQLSCPGCGEVVGLERELPLMSRLRPFVERHRACRTVAEDGEMRSAFTRVG